MTPAPGRARVRRVRERPAPFAGIIAGPTVVDASIAALWFANEPDHWGAERLLTGRSVLVAPDLMAAEVANVWWKKLRRREMEPADVEQALTNLLALGIDWTPSPALVRPAIRLAADLDHPVYDCLYLALAASRSAALATADERLREAAGRLGIRLWPGRGN